MELKEKLQALRKQKGLTQEELAAALYVSRTAISKWESGRGYPSIDSLRAIADFFSVSLDELLSGEAMLSVDNRTYRIGDDQKIVIRRAAERILLATPHNITFYETLHSKLMWDVDIRN
jgi:transcriptional regulator with XRE-family HTH domain